MASESQQVVVGTDLVSRITYFSFGRPRDGRLGMHIRGTLLLTPDGFVLEGYFQSSASMITPKLNLCSRQLTEEEAEDLVDTVRGQVAAENGDIYYDIWTWAEHVLEDYDAQLRYYASFHGDAAAALRAEFGTE